MLTRKPAVAAIALLTLSAATQLHAAVVTKSILKTFFQTGDVPTADQFSTLIDSYIHNTDDGVTLRRTGYTVTSRGTLAQTFRSDGSIFGPTTDFTPPTDLPLDPLWENNYGFLPLEFIDAAVQPHYGYIEMSQGPIDPPDPNSGAIFVYSFSYESQADTEITATPSGVPEPATLSLLALAIPVLLRRRA